MLVKEPVIFSDSGSRGERRASGVFAGFVFRELMGGDGAGGGIGHVRADGDVIHIGAGGDSGTENNSGTENTVSKATRSSLAPKPMCISACRSMTTCGQSPGLQR